MRSASTLPLKNRSPRERGYRPLVSVATHHLNKDLQRLQIFSQELDLLKSKMQEIQQQGNLKNRGYFTNTEEEEIEKILFRYLTCRRALWDILTRYRQYPRLFKSKTKQACAFILGFSAAEHLFFYGSLFILSFIDRPKVIQNLNAPFPRHEIPRDTYDGIFDSLTTQENRQAFRDAWLLFSSEQKRNDSPLSRLSAQSPEYRQEIEKICRMHPEAEQRIQKILEKRAIFLPELRNKIHHSEVNALFRFFRKIFQDNLYIARGILFTRVSRQQNPICRPLRFTAWQHKKILKRLQPGDILLSYSAGYVSNVFIPGIFKHGMTFVGSPEQRTACGLTPETIAPQVDKPEHARIIQSLSQRYIENGDVANIIEAVAEGVVFNSLKELLRTHINRLVILRPRLTPPDRQKQLTLIFEFLGFPYDFSFDFGDASRLCCTEVIYRSLNGRGKIDFPLTRRLGAPSLSADDIVRLHLAMQEKNQPVFDLILLAEEAPNRKNKAILHVDKKAELRLSALFASRDSQQKERLSCK